MLNTSFSNTDDNIKKKLETILLKCSSSKQIVGVYETINTKQYQDVFKYVPDINPVNPKKQRISSDFGRRFHPISKKYKTHHGIDIASEEGNGIYASADGKIILVSKKNSGYGYEVKIQHKYGFITRYAHMSKILCKGGQIVKKGDIIGLVGTTGFSTGPHLHYEVLKNGKRINPKPLINLKHD